MNSAYHVLGGTLSPLDGIGPDDLNIKSLVERVAQGGIKELVIAVNATVEGQTTAHYITDQPRRPRRRHHPAGPWRPGRRRTGLSRRGHVSCCAEVADETLMIIGPDVSRDARPEERDEIDALLRAAFGRPDEAQIVARLREDGDLLTEAVKPWQGVIAGFAALSWMKEPSGWACLAPLAVLPRMQRGAAAPVESQRHHYAIGTRLVSQIADLTLHSPHPPEGLPDTIVVPCNGAFFPASGLQLGSCTPPCIRSSDGWVFDRTKRRRCSQRNSGFPPALEAWLGSV